MSWEPSEDRGGQAHTNNDGASSSESFNGFGNQFEQYGDIEPVDEVYDNSLSSFSDGGEESRDSECSAAVKMAKKEKLIEAVNVAPAANERGAE